ncbi:MAG: VOC family protein [Bacteroidota bacterium]
MHIEHMAIWVADLERSRAFYETYFGAQSGEKYHNPRKHFTSYFLRFESGCRLELMHRPEIEDLRKGPGAEFLGITHFAIEVGNRKKVDELTEKFRADGYTVAGEARQTGDGYYESIILDPEGNRVELVAH